MSTEINITIGDQRLLQESKTRAAANQQSLDSRLEEQQLAEQLTEAVDEATPEDPRSDAFSLQLDRRPAAQRRKTDDKYEIARLGNLFPRPVPNSVQSFFPGIWFFTTTLFRTEGTLSCPAEPPPSTQTNPYTLSNWIQEFTERALNVNGENNFYSDISVRFAPSLSYLGSSYFLPERTLDKVNRTFFRWVSKITTLCVTFFTQCGFPFFITTFEGDVVSNGPIFPRQSINSNLSTTLQLISSTSTYLYFSTLLRHREYDVVEVESVDRRGIIRVRDFTSITQGYYVRFNTKDFTVESRIVTLSSEFLTGSFFREIAEPPSPFVSLALREAFASNFYPDDPRSSLRVVDLAQSLDFDINHFSYDPNTGAAYFYGQHTSVSSGGSPNQLSDDAFVYFTRFDKGTFYGEVVGVLKKAKLALRVRTDAPAVLTANSFTQTFTRKQIIPLEGRVESPFPSEILAIVPQA